MQPGRFARRLSDDADVDELFRRFSDHIELMVLQSARLRPVDWESALEAFVERIGEAGIGWWLYGSAALAVRGIDVMPGDVDRAVEDSGRVGEAMRDLLATGPASGVTKRGRRWRRSFSSSGWMA